MLMYFPFFHFPLSISSRADRKRRGGGALQDGRAGWGKRRCPGRAGEAAASRAGGRSGGGGDLRMSFFIFLPLLSPVHLLPTCPVSNPASRSSWRRAE
uniref:Uncharacterized protein n=1 Tax=Oryza rufipogon TaxID=4529 RepID=A0A0E0N992_ORYRU